MKRRGQSALIVIGAVIVVVLLVLITYYLSEIFITNNEDISKIGNAISVTNQLSAKADAYIKANAPIIALQLPAKLNVTLGKEYDGHKITEVPFAGFSTDVKAGYYASQNDKAFDEADVRAKYLSELYKNISSSVFYHSDLASVFISGVPFVKVDEKLPVIFKNPYEYYVTEDGKTINALFLTNHSNFIMLFPNVSVQYDPGYVVCYADKRPQVTTYDECMHENGKVVAPFLEMHNDHQLIVNTSLRPILGYDWLLLKYVAWRHAVRETFKDKAIVIPINYSHYYIFHTDPISLVIPKNYFDGKWHELSLDDKVDGTYEILTGTTEDTDDFGSINDDIHSTERKGSLTNGLRDLLTYLSFYPAFSFTKEAYDTYYRPVFFYQKNYPDDSGYVPLNPFGSPNNILYIGRDSAYSQAQAYTPDEYDSMLADLLAVSSYDFSRSVGDRDNIYFTSLYAMFRNSYVPDDHYITTELPNGLNYIQLFEAWSIANVYDSNNPFGIRINSDEIKNDFIGRGEPKDLLALYNYTKLFNAYRVITDSVAFYGAGVSKDYKKDVVGKAVEVFPAKHNGADLMLGTYLMPLFIPYNDPDTAYKKLSIVSETLPPRNVEKMNGLDFDENTLANTKVNGMTLNSLLGYGRGTRYFDFSDLVKFTSPEPEIREIYFKLSDPKVYYYAYIPDDFKVKIDEVTVGAEGDFEGIYDGTCTCSVWNGTNWTTVTCPDYKRPSGVSGGGEKKDPFSIPVARSDGGTAYDHYKTIYASGYHNFNTGYDEIDIWVDGGNDVYLSHSWGKYDLGVSNGNLGGYVFAKYSSGLVDDVGCNDSEGSYRWTAKLVKYYVGVPQIYHVKAVMEFDMSLNIIGNLYAIDDNLIREIIIKALKLDRFNPASNYVKQGLEEGIQVYYSKGSIWQGFGLLTYQNDTVGLFFTDETTADLYKDYYYKYTFIVPPSLVFVPGLYQYIPYNLTIPDVHVVIVYTFDFGYPGRVTDGIPPVEQEKGQEYNWFDVTSLITLDEHKEIMSSSDPEQKAKEIIGAFVSNFKNQFDNSNHNKDYGKLYILIQPTLSGGDYYHYYLPGLKEYIRLSQVFPKK